METFEFPKGLLEQAQKITLSELLDCPAFQPWAVSMMANAIKCSHNFDTNAADDLLEYRIDKVLKSIPYEERIHLFSLCSQMVKKRQADAKQTQRAREVFKSL